MVEKLEKDRLTKKKSSYKNAEGGETIVSGIILPEKLLHPLQSFRISTVWVCPILAGQVHFLAEHFRSTAL